jgi:gliding motility-associated protein GldM
MAGGKETPRQKMIGMMYMVLTALLALNVSSAVLEKFAIIDETLVALVKDTGEGNDALVKAIEGSTVKSAEVDEVKDKAKKVRELTKTTLAYMDGIKVEMSTDEDKKPLKGLVQDTHHADELMLNEKNGKGTSKAVAYAITLDKHVDQLNGIMKSKTPFQRITKEAKGYTTLSSAEGKINEDPYPMFAFHGTPTMGAIAYVSQQQTEIINYERVALTELLATTKGKVYEVDQLVPMVRAKSNSLVAGATYEGDLFVAGAASGVDPVMFKGGQPVKVEEVEVSKGIKIKMGKIKFVAGATGYDKDGIAKMSYPVTINIPGRDPIVQSIEYNVIKPNVKFESAASSTLYKECGNVKNVSIPGLPDMSAVNLTCSPEDGKIIPLGSGAYSLLPARANMKVRITMGGAEIGVENFSAIPVPEPQFILKYQNQDLNFEKGVPPNARVNVEIRLPENFSSQNKKDAGYRITKMRVSTRTGIKEMPSGSINLADLGARSNDVLGIVSISVVRSTYDPKDDDNLPVNFKFTPIAIPVK